MLSTLIIIVDVDFGQPSEVKFAISLPWHVPVVPFPRKLLCAAHTWVGSILPLQEGGMST